MSKKSKAQSRKGEVIRENEEVIEVIRQFPVVLRRTLIYGMLVIVLAMLPWAIAMNMQASWLELSTWWMVLVGVGLLVFWIRAWVGWRYTVYIITDQRIISVSQKGFFSRDVSELAMSNIQNVNYQTRGFSQSLFGYGNVKIETLSGGGNLVMKFVGHPSRVQQSILDFVHK